MSIKISRQVWPLKLGSAEKVVLLALADMANDAGQAWVAVRSLKGKLDLLTMTCLGERTVQGAIKSLERDGHISRTEAVGKGVRYDVHPVASSSPAPAKFAPPTPAALAPVAPAKFADVTPANAADTPARAADVPLISLFSSKTKGADGTTPKTKTKRTDRKVQLPDWLPVDAWRDFLEMRVEQENEATAVSQSRLIAKLTKLRAEGHDPREVIDTSIERGWTSFYPLKSHVPANSGGSLDDVIKHWRTTA